MATPRTPVDLLMPLGSVLDHLLDAADAGEALDAFLFAAAAVQVLEDQTHRDRLWLQRATGYFSGLEGATGRLGAVTGRLARAAFALDERLPAQRRLQTPAATLAAVRDHWASVLAEVDPPEVGRGPADALLRASVERLADVPATVRSQLVRLPSSFRSFDQHPRDMRALAAAFDRRVSDPGRAVVVVGLRTSGSYLAPLLAAELRRVGYGDVVPMTIRPGHPLHRDEAAMLTRLVPRAGLVAVVDDPPTTGGSIEATIRSIEGLGIDGAAIVPCFSVFDDAEIDRRAVDRLAAWQPIVLPFSDWDIHERMTPERVAAAVHRLTGVPIDLGPGEPIDHRRREHLASLYPVLGSVDRFVVAEGVGLGWFGRHAAAVTERIAGHALEPIGFDDGILLAWVNGRPIAARPAPATVAGYAETRRRAVPADTDRAGALHGRQAVWEVAANIVGESLGRLGPFLRPAAIDGVVQRLLHLETPSVIDGRAGDGWLETADGIRKRETSEGAFSHRDLWCYDATFDIVPFTATAKAEEAAAYRAAWAAERQAEISPERWMLLELVHLWDQRRDGKLERAQLWRHQARAVHLAFGARWLPKGAATGWPLAALDLDGVLECTVAGFAAPTTAGVTALATLVAHDYRPVVCTGRSVGEVIDRCVAYGLAGGVAEYGSAVVVTETERLVSLVEPGEQAQLDELRRALVEQGWRLDGGFTYAVRAWRTGGSGLRGGTETEIAAALAGRPGVVAVRGEGQTDFIAAGVDKGRGLARLQELLQVDGELPPIAFAMGDTAADLPMLDLAEVGRAPANASPGLDARIARTRGAYQLGVLEAVHELVGHHRGECVHCRPAGLSADVARLQAALSVFEGGAKGAPRRLAGLLRR